METSSNRQQLLRNPGFKGFTEDDVNIAKSTVRLHYIEAEEDKTRIEIKGVQREKEETKCIKEILKQLNDEDENTKFEQEVEEVMRLGPYIEGVRPIKLRLKTQTATEEILVRTYKLRNIAEYKDVLIKKSMNEEERQQLKKLKEEAKQKKDERTTEEKTKFFLESK